LPQIISSPDLAQPNLADLTAVVLFSVEVLENTVNDGSKSY